MTGATSHQTLHATSVAIGGRAVLLHGPSGAGKSDLALRLIDRGAVLVSDDYTILTAEGGQLIATAPATIADKMEVRGIGVVDMPHADSVPVALIAHLGDVTERLPAEGASRRIAGIDIPLVRIAPLEASAPIKVELALRELGRT
ncbi:MULTISPECIES: HPr kinase/phosphorylase [Sphingobium]|jgi:serine kinase of HPr protein (carbohydrate metabolism regulator)|uniref:Aldolase n=1 Tax=Sphingobium baderi TaxID=1332080 RepID=A0A0S3EWU0_9SPHN|nr:MULTISPECIES: HPr kinase/phosphatase C-terminal domain-containing protein [Sphingobium]ALR19886.1 aldolase [Sphingobium baderi]